MISKKKQLFITALVILVIYVAWVFSHKAADPFQTKLTTTEKVKVDELLKDLQTRCIGRYLVDLPASYFVAENSREKINGMIITTTRMYHPSFNSEYIFENKNYEPQKQSAQMICLTLKKRIFCHKGLTVSFLKE